MVVVVATGAGGRRLKGSEAKGFIGRQLAGGAVDCGAAVMAMFEDPWAMEREELPLPLFSSLSSASGELVHKVL